MDVACTRCRAEYEFDDALISERGTTVFCTTCGLQFKIFPAERGVAPEEWTLTPAVPGAAVRTFDSLRDLQRAILDGAVRESDLLARGGERPRPLGSIAELESMLRRPRSAAPPARLGAAPLGQNVFAGDALRRTAGGTVMGLAAPRVPTFAAESPPAGSLPPVAPRSHPGARAGEDDDSDAIVPSSPQEGHGHAAEPWQVPPRQTLRPKIQSVLSRAPSAPAVPESSMSAAPPSSSRLRATLSSSAPATPPGAARQRSAGTQPDAPADAPASRQSRFDSEPFSVMPATRPRPLARGAWIVVSVLVGMAAFALTAARERIFALFDDGQKQEPLARVVSAERALLAAVELTDEAWLRVRMATVAERAAREAALEARLVALEQALDEGSRVPAGQSATWSAQRVHYLRMKGDLAGARAALGQVKGAALVDPYLLAMLDLAEGGGQRPFGSILRRLKDASSGERGRYRMRSAYIVALVESGNLAEAKEDFARLAQNGDANSAPLYGDLARFLDESSKAAAAGAKVGP